MSRLDLDELARAAGGRPGVPQGRGQGRPIVVSLFDYSGAWARPWMRSHDVILVDIAHPAGVSQAEGMTRFGMDVLDFIRRWPLPGFGRRKVDVLLAAPPCTRFCLPGARLWKRWDEDGSTRQDLLLVTSTLEFAKRIRPRIFALENPPGRLWNKKGTGLLQAELGPPLYDFQPWMHGDAHTKRTYLWGWFTPPERHPVEPEPMPDYLPPGRRDRTSRMSSSWKRVRAETPLGFARAFYRFNSLPAGGTSVRAGSGLPAGGLSVRAGSGAGGRARPTLREGRVRGRAP